MMDYFCVKNWRQFQHYKHRNPPWIKLYTHLLDDYEFGCLPDASKLLAFYIILLAAKTGNKLPANVEWIKNRASLTETPDLQPLFDIGFIQELDASNALAERVQNADSEKSREEKKERMDGQKAVSEEEASKNRERLAVLRDTIAGKMRVMP